MQFVFPLQDISEPEAWRCGAKAATLGRLLRKGFPIPPGFVVTADGLDFLLKENDLFEELSATLDDMKMVGPDMLDSLSARLRHMITDAWIPTQLADEIHGAVASLGDVPMAIRSSSSFEDRHDLSFAGQHDTYLNVTGPRSCMDAFLRVCASLYNNGVLSLLQAWEISPKVGRMAVLVQAMESPLWAGVGFTVHPVSGDPSALVIHAVRGQGEKCVNGCLATEEATVDRPTMTLIDVTTSTGEDHHPMGTDLLVEVADLMTRAESTLSVGPLDVEWAVTPSLTGHGPPSLRLLQARPMTSVARTPQIRWDSPVPGAHWRKRWRLGEWLRDPVTPLFATMAIPRLTTARETFGNGKLGWRHLPSFTMPSPWFCLVHGFFYARQDLPPDVGAGMPFPARLERMQALRDFVQRWQAEDLPAYRQRAAQRKDIDLDSFSPRELVDFIQSLLNEAAELWYVIAPLGYGFEAMVFEPHYRRVLGDASPHFSILFRGFPNPSLNGQQLLYDLAMRIRSDAPTLTLLKSTPPETLAGNLALLPDWLHRELDGYRDRFGHLVHSLDFFFPTSGEDLTETLAALRALTHQDVESPGIRLEKNRKAREAAQLEVRTRLEKLGQEGAELAILMDCFQTNAAAREEAIFSFQLAWPLLRRALLSLGKQLVNAGVLQQVDRIFFLEQAELLGAAMAIQSGESVPDLSEIARGRQETWQRRRKFEAPDSIPDETQNPQVNRRCGYVEDDEGAHLVGLGVSAGSWRGRVRIVKGVDAPIDKGDVLVTSMASPSLTPLMLLAGALVVDIGGGASHSSLVARELGLPTVVNTIEATRRLKDGQLVEVHGSQGLVRIL